MRFALKNLENWTDFPSGHVLPFDLDAGEVRDVVCRLFADYPIRVYVVTLDSNGNHAGLIPVAVGDGELEISFSTSKPCGLAWFADDGVQPLVRFFSLSRTQLLGDDAAEGAEASFTVVEPRGPRESDELARIRRLMEINVERRLRAQEEAFRAMLAANAPKEAEVIEATNDA